MIHRLRLWWTTTESRRASGPPQHPLISVAEYRAGLVPGLRSRVHLAPARWRPSQNHRIYIWRSKIHPLISVAEYRAGLVPGLRSRVHLAPARWRPSQNAALSAGPAGARRSRWCRRCRRAAGPPLPPGRRRSRAGQPNPEPPPCPPAPPAPAGAVGAAGAGVPPARLCRRAAGGPKMGAITASWLRGGR